MWLFNVLVFFFFFPNNVKSYDPRFNPMIHDPTYLLRFYDSTYPKQSGYFKDFCDSSGLVGSYNSNDLKRSWFLVIFFN